MKYAVKMGSGAIIYVLKVMKVDSGIQKLMGGDTQTHRQQTFGRASTARWALSDVKCKQASVHTCGEGELGSGPGHPSIHYVLATVSQARNRHGEGRTCYLLDAGFLLGLFFDSEDGDNIVAYWAVAM
jgi:hypothetical protein